MRRGDFSETGPIYDPLTTRANPNGAGFIRTQFAGKHDSPGSLGSDRCKADQRVPRSYQFRPV